MLHGQKGYGACGSEKDRYDAALLLQPYEHMCACIQGCLYLTKQLKQTQIIHVVYVYPLCLLARMIPFLLLTGKGNKYVLYIIFWSATFCCKQTLHGTWFTLEISLLKIGHFHIICNGEQDNCTNKLEITQKAHCF
jgi:hypothetical protein